MIEIHEVDITGGLNKVLFDKVKSEKKKLEQDREILKSFIVRHHPEMEGWIRKNFGKVKEK